MSCAVVCEITFILANAVSLLKYCVLFLPVGYYKQSIALISKSHLYLSGDAADAAPFTSPLPPLSLFLPAIVSKTPLAPELMSSLSMRSGRDDDLLPPPRPLRGAKTIRINPQGYCPVNIGSGRERVSGGQGEKGLTDRAKVF